MNTAKRRAIVIGRHVGEIPGYEIIQTRNVVWPAHSRECAEILVALRGEAAAIGAAVVLQNTPGQVAAALSRCASDERMYAEAGQQCDANANVYVIVSVPALAVEGEARQFEFSHLERLL